MLKPRKRNSIKEFWLSTNTSALRTRQYIDNSQACLNFFIWILPVYFEIEFLKIAIILTRFGSKFQYAIIGVGY